MMITNKNKDCFIQAMKVDFLTEPWEVAWYTKALMNAVAWGEKVDRENMDYRKKHRLTDKYNV